MCNRLVKRSYHLHNSSVILRMSPPSFSVPLWTSPSSHLYMSIIPRPSSVFRPSFFLQYAQEQCTARVLQTVTPDGIGHGYAQTVRSLGRKRA